MTALQAEKLYYETYLKLKMKATDENKPITDRELSLKGFEAILNKMEKINGWKEGNENSKPISIQTP